MVAVSQPLIETGAGAVDGERAARLARLIRAQFGFVWRLLRRIGVTEAEAPAAVRDVFAAAAQRIGDIRSDSERSFLFGTTLHVAARVRRERTDQEAISDGAPALEDLDEQAQAREILGALLEQMPLELRVVYVLHEIEQLTTAEIAKVVGIPIGTVDTRLVEAQEDFATHLESDSDLSLSLIAAAREEQPPADALSRALEAVGVATVTAAPDPPAGAVSSPSVSSVRPGSPQRSLFTLAAKWIAVGWIVGLVLGSAVYALSEPPPAAHPAAAKR